MVDHTQIGTHDTVFFEPQMTEVGDGTLQIPAGNLWVGGTAYPLVAYHPTVGTAPFRLFVEPIPGGADYALDFTMDYLPASFGEGKGSVTVAWRETLGAVHVLRSVHA